MSITQGIKDIWLITVDFFVVFVSPFKKVKELSEKADLLYAAKVFLVTSIVVILFGYYLNIYSPNLQDHFERNHSYMEVISLGAGFAFFMYLLYYSPSIFETFFISVLVYIIGRKSERLELGKILGTLSVVFTGSYVLSLFFMFIIFPSINSSTGRSFEGDINQICTEAIIVLIRLVYVFIFIKVLTKRISHAAISIIALLPIEISLLLLKFIMFAIARID